MSETPGLVEIVHPSGLTSQVLPRTVPGWETAGWTRADNGSEESGQQARDTSSHQESGDEPDDVTDDPYDEHEE